MGVTRPRDQEICQCFGGPDHVSESTTPVGVLTGWRLVGPNQSRIDLHRVGGLAWIVRSGVVRSGRAGPGFAALAGTANDRGPRDG